MISGDAALTSYDSSTSTYNGGQPMQSNHTCPGRTATRACEPRSCFSLANGAIHTYQGRPRSPAKRKLANGGCPPTHLVVLSLLFYEVLYWTIGIDQSGGGEFVFA